MKDFNDLFASALDVKGPAKFTDVIVEHSANFSDSNFTTLDLSRSVWPEHGKNGGVFELWGMNFKNLRAASDEPRSHQALLKLVDQSAYAPDIYENLERFFFRRGYRQDADRAFIAGRHHERKYLYGVSWIANWIGDVLTDYGRHPSRAGIPCVFFVILGCFLFSSRKMEPLNREEATRVYNPFWYSLGLFLPIVNLQSDGVWKPKKHCRFLRHYLRVHVLLGWILMPILLGALAGVIK